MKKGQGISINVIIIAAIALLVLVILAVLVIRAGTNTGERTQACTVVGGRCASDCAGKEPLDGKCPTEGDQCCPIFTTG